MEASIIIPCYNASATIVEAVESALAQTVRKCEVVVVDDGSTDDSFAQLRRYADRIVLLRQANRGACAARNLGLARSRGRWIQFLDADDQLHPQKVERQIAHAQQLSGNTSSICLGEEESGEGFLHEQYQRRLAPARDLVDFVLHGVLATPAPLHRRASLVAVRGFDESLPCAQEYDLHLRLMCAGWHFEQLAETLFIVRRQIGSVSSDSLKVIRQMPRILERTHDILASRGALDPARRRSLAIAMVRAGTRLVEGGEGHLGETLIGRARSLDSWAELHAWTAPWRPLVWALGSVRTRRIYTFLLVPVWTETWLVAVDELYRQRGVSRRGAMVVNGTHYIDLAIEWFGYPLAIEYFDDSTGGGEANAVAYTTHGVLGQRCKGCIKISRTADLDSGMVIRSHRASVVLRDSRPNDLIIAVQGRAAQVFKQVNSTAVNDMYLAQLEDFIDMCQHGKAPLVGLDAGIANIQFVEQMYSARKPLAGDWYGECPSRSV